MTNFRGILFFFIALHVVSVLHPLSQKRPRPKNAWSRRCKLQRDLHMRQERPMRTTLRRIQSKTNRNASDKSIRVGSNSGTVIFETIISHEKPHKLMRKKSFLTVHMLGYVTDSKYQLDYSVFLNCEMLVILLQICNKTGLEKLPRVRTNWLEQWHQAAILRFHM